MRTRILLPAIFSLILFNSCTIEDEFTDLSQFDDLLLETTVFFKEDAERYEIPITYFKTDGYNSLTERHINHSGNLRVNKLVFYQTIKKYKKAGLNIIPGENVSSVWVTMYELGVGKEIYYNYYSEDNRPFTYLFDFETDTYEVVFE